MLYSSGSSRFLRGKKSADTEAPLFVTSCFSAFETVGLSKERVSHVQAGLECSNRWKDILTDIGLPASTWLVL